MFSAHTAENKGCIFFQLSCNYVWLWLSSGERNINWIVWQFLETFHKRKLAYAFCPVLLSASLLLGSLVLYSQIGNTVSQPWHHSHSGLGWFSGMCCSISSCQWHPSPLPDCTVAVRHVSTLPIVLWSGVDALENCWSRTANLRPGMAKPLVPLGITEGALFLEQLGATVMDSLPLTSPLREKYPPSLSHYYFQFPSLAVILNFN